MLNENEASIDLCLSQWAKECAGELRETLLAAQRLIRTLSSRVEELTRETEGWAAAATRHALRFDELTERAEGAERLAYTGATSLASIDEDTTCPETWKERAENRQAVFLLAKRRVEAAENRSEERRQRINSLIDKCNEFESRSAELAKALEEAKEALESSCATLKNASYPEGSIGAGWTKESLDKITVALVVIGEALNG